MLAKKSLFFFGLDFLLVDEFEASCINKLKVATLPVRWLSQPEASCLTSVRLYPDLRLCSTGLRRFFLSYITVFISRVPALF